MYITLQCPNCQRNYYEPMLVCKDCRFGPILPPAPKKSVAQQVALLMLLADWVLIVPASLGAAVLAILGLQVMWLTLLVGVGYGVGLWLFVGYHRYVTRRKVYGGPVALWGGTLVYNLIGFGMTFLFYREAHSKDLWLAEKWCWWLAWLVLWSAIALVSDIRAYRAALRTYQPPHNLLP